MSIRSNVDLGRLNERVVIERQTPIQSSNGQITTSWSVLITCWAAVDGRKVDESRAEAMATGKMQNTYDYAVWIRADVLTRMDVRLSDRIRWRGQVFDIVNILDQQLRGRLAQMFVRAGSSDG